MNIIFLRINSKTVLDLGSWDDDYHPPNIDLLRCSRLIVEMYIRN